ncbi:class Ib ribonucleoside-diphosphate reductase assembly flavoprotein NrdI [Lentilactobacillus senioris]|uniref:NrdI protein n=1 Tax=Lentilactobacillus senioris DSM 24302 = JCM 17472 TaxID=1423802 RepID=A0A0R2CPA2_9LACO|nr:class Ib ribonucleoside-diphosphate reductase assembly flavoprotein NrdI [Lentilactobacillus senioris]KRM93351.1 nrdI protein [Lentilactobacillus senioris DSM 24302 = JCM 17472]
MEPIRLLYISIEGNTRSFADKLQNYANGMHDQNSKYPQVELKEISDQSDFENETQPYFISVPTYLTGGNGIDSGVTELMTNSFGEYLAYNDNAKYCWGVIGSGNRNFNEQYCLTARRYAEAFDAPFIADFELRGTGRDVERIYQILIAETQKHEN